MLTTPLMIGMTSRVWRSTDADRERTNQSTAEKGISFNRIVDIHRGADSWVMATSCHTICVLHSYMLMLYLVTRLAWVKVWILMKYIVVSCSFSHIFISHYVLLISYLYTKICWVLDSSIVHFILWSRPNNNPGQSLTPVTGVGTVGIQALFAWQLFHGQDLSV